MRGAAGDKKREVTYFFVILRCWRTACQGSKGDNESCISGKGAGADGWLEGWGMAWAEEAGIQVPRLAWGNVISLTFSSPGRNHIFFSGFIQGEYLENSPIPIWKDLHSREIYFEVALLVQNTYQQSQNKWVSTDLLRGFLCVRLLLGCCKNVNQRKALHWSNRWKKTRGFCQGWHVVGMLSRKQSPQWVNLLEGGWAGSLFIVEQINSCMCTCSRNQHLEK